MHALTLLLPTQDFSTTRRTRLHRVLTFSRNGEDYFCPRVWLLILRDRTIFIPRLRSENRVKIIPLSHRLSSEKPWFFHGDDGTSAEYLEA